MNTIKNIDVEYILSSRTIETVLVSNNKISKIFYVYNYEGNFYRVFESILSIVAFFKQGIESTICFDNENSLDNYLSNIEIQ